jgi:leader peptidase (prepilin peptidase)/N-methyltransferase
MSTIFYFILFAFTGLAISPFMNALIKRFSLEENILTKDILKDVKFDILVTIITPLLLIALFYKFGISTEFFMYSWIGIILIMDAFIDVRKQIIPNGLNFIGFLVGIIIAYLVGMDNVYKSLDLLLGMVTGAGIFILIALFAVIAYKKEGMGLGDVKLMGMLGLYFGFANTIQIFILSFFVGAIISIILLITKLKTKDDYIPFGPFIVIGAVFTMFIPASTMMPYVLQILK